MRQTTDAPDPNSGEFRPRLRVVYQLRDEVHPAAVQPHDPTNRAEAQAIADALNAEWQAFGYEYYIEEY